MRRASVAKLKEQLSRYLQAVKAGEEILVTERGRPIALLTPIAAPEQMEARLNWLIRMGLARPPLTKPSKALLKDFWKLPRPKDPNGRVLELLLEERAEAR